MSLSRVIQKIIDKAAALGYGEIKVSFTVSRGKVAKITMTEVSEVVLVNEK